MAVIRIQPEHRKAVCDAMLALAFKSRSEPGCVVRYEVFQRVGEAELVTQEIWTDATAKAAHLAGPNIASAFASIGQYLAAAPEIHRYTQLV